MLVCVCVLNLKVFFNFCTNYVIIVMVTPGDQIESIAFPLSAILGAKIMHKGIDSETDGNSRPAFQEVTSALCKRSYLSISC